MDGGDEAYGGRRRQSRKFTEAERKTFYTVSGRPVKDGGGIVPDVVEKPRKIGELERILLEQAGCRRWPLATHRLPSPRHALAALRPPPCHTPSHPR